MVSSPHALIGAVSARPLGALARRSSRRAGVVLAYHDVAEETLRAHLSHLQRHYRIVPAAHIVEAAARRSRGEAFPVAVTFDDDDASRLVSARVLRESGESATFFLADPELIGALRALDMAVGFHTTGHTRLTGLGADGLDHVLADGRPEAEAAGGRVLELVAYPYGAADERVAAAAARAGFRLGFTTFPKAVRPGDAPHQLGRVDVGDHPAAALDYRILRALLLPPRHLVPRLGRASR